ncbi:MAG: DNA-binding protein [Alphaproteobacteria bacterium]|nr:MAG: DNA-binding protein [Alphaproteobacteria bacterium]
MASDLPKLAAPARRALARAGVTNLSDLATMTEADVVALHGMGPSAMTTIKAAMKAKKLAFAKR